MVIPIQADNYLSGENTIKGWCKFCYCHLLLAFTLEWLGVGKVDNSYQMDGKDSDLMLNEYGVIRRKKQKHCEQIFNRNLQKKP